MGNLRQTIGILALTAVIALGCTSKPQAQQTAPTPQETPTDYAGWTVGSFTDEFGDKTDSHFLRNIYQGKISTISLGDINMTAKCTIDSSAFRIEFYDYGKYLIKNFGQSELRIKDSEGKVHEFSQFSNDGMRFTGKNRDSIINVLNHNGTIKASIRIEENSNGRHGSFSIKGTDRLKELMTTANVK